VGVGGSRAAVLHKARAVKAAKKAGRELNAMKKTYSAQLARLQAEDEAPADLDRGASAEELAACDAAEHEQEEEERQEQEREAAEKAEAAADGAAAEARPRVGSAAEAEHASPPAAHVSAAQLEAARAHFKAASAAVEKPWQFFGVRYGVLRWSTTDRFASAGAPLPISHHEQAAANPGDGDGDGDGDGKDKAAEAAAAKAAAAAAAALDDDEEGGHGVLGEVSGLLRTWHWEARWTAAHQLVAEGRHWAR
jgi:NADH-quinone oxidoreductase subunit C